MGRIFEGYLADMILLDKELKVRHCWVGGKSVYTGRKW